MEPGDFYYQWVQIKSRALGFQRAVVGTCGARTGGQEGMGKVLEAIREGHQGMNSWSKLADRSGKKRTGN